MLNTGVLSGQVLDRESATRALHAEGNIVIDTTRSAVWSPRLNLSGTPRLEGMLPKGTMILPALTENDEEKIVVESDSFFFWIDDEPTALFSHPTRFVLVDANVPDPTLDSGITVTAEEWWPVIDDGQTTTELFSSDRERSTDKPAGPDNPDGLITGNAYRRSDVEQEHTLPVTPQVPFTNGCALIVKAGRDNFLKNDVWTLQHDLMRRFGIRPERILILGFAPGMDDECPVPTPMQVRNALRELSRRFPDCDEVSVSWTGHATRRNRRGVLKLRDGVFTAEEFCQEVQQLGNAWPVSVPIHILINTCHSGALLEDLIEDRWRLPRFSTVVVSSEARQKSYGGPHNDRPDGSGEDFTGSGFLHAFSRCLNDPGADRDGDEHVSRLEAVAWIRETLPCYRDRRKNGANLYPGGDRRSPDKPGGVFSRPRSFIFLSRFMRGDADTSGDLDMNDGVTTLDSLFRGGELTCRDAADVDDSGTINLTDAVFLFNHLFRSGFAPPPPDVCGNDPTDDKLDCRAFSECP